MLSPNSLNESPFILNFVSRETKEKLYSYSNLLVKWNSTLNLISHSTLDDLWNRHIVDSLQLFPLLAGENNIVDMGSGGGFPGLVLAILGIDVTLIESDQRKCEFLRTVARETQVNATIINGRAENQNMQGYNVFIARAFAPLSKLLLLIHRKIAPRQRLLLLKGRSYRKELEEARNNWHFDCELLPSITDSKAAILDIRHIQKKDNM